MSKLFYSKGLFNNIKVFVTKKTISACPTFNTIGESKSTYELSDNELVEQSIIGTEIDTYLGFNKNGNRHSNGKCMILKTWFGKRLYVGVQQDCDIEGSYDFKRATRKETIRYLGVINETQVSIDEVMSEYEDEINKYDESILEVVESIKDCGIEDTIQPYNFYISEEDDTILLASLSERNYKGLVGTENNIKNRGGYELLVNKMVYQILYPLISRLNQNGYSVEIIDVRENMSLDSYKNAIKTDNVTPIIQLRCVPIMLSIFETTNELSLENNIITV